MYALSHVVPALGVDLLARDRCLGSLAAVANHDQQTGALRPPLRANPGLEGGTAFHPLPGNLSTRTVLFRRCDFTRPLSPRSAFLFAVCADLPRLRTTTPDPTSAYLPLLHCCGRFIRAKYLACTIKITHPSPLSSSRSRPPTLPTVRCCAASGLVLSSAADVWLDLSSDVLNGHS